MEPFDSVQYAAQLLALLPPGRAFTGEAGTVTADLLDALAQELTRIDARAVSVFEEALPDTTRELLPDWERVVGLPDACAPLDTSESARREAVVARLRAQGGQNADYYIQLAAWLGYPGGVVEEFAGRAFTANSNCTDHLYSDPWRFVWILEVPRLPDGSRDWQLECLLQRCKPAHTHVIVRYATHYYVQPDYWELGYAVGDLPAQRQHA